MTFVSRSDMHRVKVLTVVGTRPEAIKMSPVILRLRQEPDVFESIVCVTAQHREMLDSVFELFGLRADIDLDLMQRNQTLTGLTSRVLEAMDQVVVENRADWTLVHGDSTTAMATSLAAFHRHVRTAHVEAGLRTYNLQSPFPEEMNRRVTDLIADAHFAPTRCSVEALEREGIPSDRIHCTGNTVVDALHWVAAREPAPADEQTVLITCHRRESFGEPMERIFRAIRQLAFTFPEIEFVFPVHPNPNVQTAAAHVSDIPNVHLERPADYRQFVRWLRAARLVLTDSGGVQEEAPAFGKPTLILRDTTERTEGIKAGAALLVGTNEERIVAETRRLLTDPAAYATMSHVRNPYGDGHAADRVAAVLSGRPMIPFDPELSADSSFDPAVGAVS